MYPAEDYRLKMCQIRSIYELTQRLEREILDWMVYECGGVGWRRTRFHFCDGMSPCVSHMEIVRSSDLRRSQIIHGPMRVLTHSDHSSTTLQSMRLLLVLFPYVTFSVGAKTLPCLRSILTFISLCLHLYETGHPRETAISGVRRSVPDGPMYHPINHRHFLAVSLNAFPSLKSVI